MKTRKQLLLLAALIPSAALFAAGALVGCEKGEDKTASQQQKTAGERVRGAGEATGNAVSRGVKSAGDATGRAVDRSTDAARQAGAKTGEAVDTARGAAGGAAQTSGEAVGRAGRATNEWISPSTAPTTTTAPANTPTNEKYPLPAGK